MTDELISRLEADLATAQEHYEIASASAMKASQLMDQARVERDLVQDALVTAMRSTLEVRSSSGE